MATKTKHKERSRKSRRKGDIGKNYFFSDTARRNETLQMIRRFDHGC